MLLYKWQKIVGSNCLQVQCHHLYQLCENYSVNYLLYSIGFYNSNCFIRLSKQTIENNFFISMLEMSYESNSACERN